MANATIPFEQEAPVAPPVAPLAEAAVPPDARDVDHRVPWMKASPFVAIHLGAVAAVVYLGWSWKGALLALALYYVRMFGVTGAYHRYFSHRTFKTSRAFQLVLAVLAMTSFQKGVLWWAAHHRVHHKHSDQAGDLHSMKRDGFWWSHMGWIMAKGYEETDMNRVRDLAKYPELVWLNKFWWVPPVAYSALCYALGGTFALVWGVGVSTVFLWHGTFCINSLSHWMGRVRYRTTDESKNSAILAVITMGEGWHNNHHYYQRATNQGFYWWEFDPTFYVLKMLSWVGLVWHLHVPPEHVRRANHVHVATQDVAPMHAMPQDAE